MPGESHTLKATDHTCTHNLINEHTVFWSTFKCCYTFYILIDYFCLILSGSIVVKNPPTNAGDARDMGLILGSEDPLEKEMTTDSTILAWEIP